MENQTQLSREDINVNAGTSFSLMNDSGELDVSGDILDPQALRALADTLEKLYSGQIPAQGVIGFDLD
jgi:hypothetical protein